MKTFQVTLPITIVEVPTTPDNRWESGQRKVSFRVKAKSYYDAERILEERMSRLLGDWESE